MARLEAQINPDMLEWARASAGYTLEEAARRLRIEPVRLSSWEVGMSRPTVPQLRIAAHLYKRPVAAFFLPQAPPDEPLIHDFRKMPGNAPRHMSAELRYAIRAARSGRLAALDLMEDLGES